MQRGLFVVGLAAVAVIFGAAVAIANPAGGPDCTSKSWSRALPGGGWAIHCPGTCPSPKTCESRSWTSGGWTYFECQCKGTDAAGATTWTVETSSGNPCRHTLKSRPVDGGTQWDQNCGKVSCKKDCDKADIEPRSGSNIKQCSCP